MTQGLCVPKPSSCGVPPGPSSASSHLSRGSPSLGSPFTPVTVPQSKLWGALRGCSPSPNPKGGSVGRCTSRIQDCLCIPIPG